MGMVFKKIFREGIQQRPFEAHKRYEVTDVNYSSSFEISILRAISDDGVLLDVSSSVAGVNIPDPRIISGSGAASDELNHIPQQINWYSLNSTFFKRRRDITLYETASIMSIPQNKFGDGIKPESVTVTDNSHYPSSSISLSDIKVDEEYGILIANELTSSAYVNTRDVLVYLDFNGDLNDRSNYSSENRII